MRGTKRFTRSAILILALVATLVGGNALPTYAAVATVVTDPNNPTLTAPTGPIWLGADPWVGDHFLGFCKLVINVPTGFLEPDPASCVTAPTGPTSPGHAALPPGGSSVYVPDNAAVAPDNSGVWRLAFAAGAITQRTMIASVAALGADKVSSVAWGPDNKLYVAFITSSRIVRIANPAAAGGATAPIIEPVGDTSDAGGANALAFAGNDLYIAQDASVTKIAGAAACAGACIAAATPALASVPTALLVDGNFLYIGDTTVLERLDVVAGTAVLFSNGGTSGTAPASFRSITGLGINPGTNDLYVGDDASGIANVFAGRVWRIVAGQAPGATVPTGLRVSNLIGSGVSAALTQVNGFVVLGGVLWVADHAMGFCRLKTGTAPGTVAIDVPTCTTQTHPTSGPTAAGQPSFDPATNFVYLPDSARGSQQVWRYTYDPATRTLNSPTALTIPSATLDLRPVGSAIGPDGNLYVSAIRTGEIFRLTTPNGPAVQISQSSDGGGVLSLAFMGSDLYLAQAAAVRGIANAVSPVCTPATCPAVPNASQAIAPAALVSDGSKYLYIADGNIVERFEPASGQSVTFSTQGLANGTPAPYRFITGLGLGGGAGIVRDLFIGDDPSGGAAALQGRLWLSQAIRQTIPTVSRNVIQ